MKLALKILGSLVLLLVLIGAGGYLWASSAAAEKLSRTFDLHDVDFPVPFPLSDAEIEELGIDAADAPRVALEQATERGRHLVDSRYACTECHGDDFSGGVMMDAPPIGRILGPNLTAGEGSRTAGYTPADWDRIVRHGVLPDGRPAAMPSDDYARMSDQELSDVIAYITSRPAVDNVVDPPSLGPLGKFLMATGAMPLSVDRIESHSEAHVALPPPAEPTIEFGTHLAAVCAGCHGPTFAGGPIGGGDPSWPPARNLTPHADGLAGWTFEQFEAAMRQGRRPDGTELLEPMAMITPYAQQMTDIEMRALWMYLQALPPEPTPAG